MAQKQRKDLDDGKSGLSPFAWVLIGTGVLAVALIAYNVGQRTLGDMATAPVQLDIANDQELVEMAQGMVAGDPDAPATIVEFGDFQCPGCGGFARQVKPLVDRQLIDTGRASFVFYDFPLVGIHGSAFLAARAARCAGDQDRFWDFHDQLFLNQAQWSTASNPASRFERYASDLGLDSEAFEECLRSDRHAQTVTANMMLGEALGVTGTPTVMVSRGQGMATRLQSTDFNTIADAVAEAAEGAAGGDAGN